MKTKIIASALLLLTIISIFAVTEQQTGTTRDVILDHAGQENLLLATAIAKHGDELFTSLTRPSLVIATAFTKHDDESARRFIRQRVLLPASVLDITQYDARGRCVWSYIGRCTGTGTHNAEHHSDVAYLQDNPDATIHVSRTYQSHSLQRLTFRLSRPLRSKTHEFGGVISTFVDPLALIQTYKPLLKNEIARIALIGKDGYIRTRMFGSGRITHDDDVQQRPVNASARSTDSGMKIVKAPSDGRDMMIAWKALESFPLYIISATPVDLELSPYAKSRRETIAAAFILILAAIGIYLAFFVLAAHQRSGTRNGCTETA